MKWPARARWLLLGLGVGGAFLWLALGQIDAREVWRVAAAADAKWAFVAWACGAAFMLLKAWRWRFLLASIDRFEFGVLHRAVYAGTAANLLVPHSGEVLRATLLGMKAHRPASPILTTIGLERILDFAALSILASVGLVMAPVHSDLLLWGGLAGAAIVLLGLAGVAACLHPTPVLRRWSGALLGLLPTRQALWIGTQMRRGVAGLDAIRYPGLFLGLVALSVGQWACIVGAILACGAAVATSLPVAGAILVFVLTVVGLTLPSPPAQLGATQFAFVIGFESCAAGADEAFAASMVYTVIVLGSMALIGAASGAFSNWRRIAPPARPARDLQG